ncbi:hypothetical protein [Frondihabitans cladoniiphilus]|uniref:DUF4190 domain-containing protein n=1 Tax=Frondihabitans cladoniiphilus TaxID=715785 RepID=A0ABP8W9V8_9MICO
MSDERPREVTAMSLRAEKLRRTMLRASGGHSARDDPGLSPARPPKNPELVNRWANLGLAVGVLALFVDFAAVPSVVAVVLCVFGLRQARALDRRDLGRYGRRRSLWGIGFAAFGVAGILFNLLIRPLYA